VTFADVLLRVVPGAPLELERLGVGVDLARRLQSRLIGVYVSHGDGKAEWARALFERAVSRSPLETSWRVIDGSSDFGLMFLARRSDLVILPGMGADSVGCGCTPDQVALQSGRPVLILPQREPSLSVGGTVVVAWNESPHSARALHDAMPILVAADRVLVLRVLHGDGSEPMTDVRLLEHLHQNGVPAELVRRHGEDEAEEIASEVRRADADMLVIGLHETQDRLERRLGSVGERFVRTGSLAVFGSG